MENSGLGCPALLGTVQHTVCQGLVVIPCFHSDIAKEAIKSKLCSDVYR